MQARWVRRKLTAPSGKKVLDFGQNIAGYIIISLNAKKGQKIYLRFGEMLDENGEFTQKTFNAPTKNARKLHHCNKSTTVVKTD